MKSLLMITVMAITLVAFVGCKKEETLGDKLDKKAKAVEKAAADAAKKVEKAAADAAKKAEKEAGELQKKLDKELNK